MKKEEVFVIFLITFMIGGLFFNILNRLLDQSNKTMFYYIRFKKTANRNVELQYKWEHARMEKYNLEEQIRKLK